MITATACITTKVVECCKMLIVDGLRIAEIQRECSPPLGWTPRLDSKLLSMACSVDTRQTHVKAGISNYLRSGG